MTKYTEAELNEFSKKHLVKLMLDQQEQLARLNDNMERLLEQFSCAYMTGADSPLYRFGLCLNKMFDAMMAGLPIVCAFNAPDTLVRLHQCGYQCDPSDRKKVASAIRAIRSMQPEDRAQMGRNGRTAVMQHYTYELLAAQFLQSACEP